MSHLIKRVVRTAKTEPLRRHNLYVFDLDIRLNKQQIKKLFKLTFEVDVIKVNTHIGCFQTRRSGLKLGYVDRYKRTIIKLPKGQTVPL
jgi:ribosomal protein L23